MVAWLLCGCAGLGNADLEVRAAAEDFLLGDAEAADARLAANDQSVVEALRAWPADPSVGEMFATLADAHGVALDALPATTEVCDGFVGDDPERVEQVESTTGALSRAVLSGGSSPNCRMATVGAECAENDLMLSVFLGFTTDPADVTDYLTAWLRYDLPSATAVMLAGAPTTRVYRFAWLGATDGPHQFNAYVCLPWQLTWHEAGLWLSHDPDQVVSEE